MPTVTASPCRGSSATRATPSTCPSDVTSFGASTIKYEAYPRSAGTEVLHYQVADRFGATSTGFVRIGVVQPGDPQPPVAVEDEVRAAPGKTVTVDVTENDLIARGDAVDLEYEELNEKAELARWKIDRQNTYFSTTVQAPERGVQHLTYGITNGLFDLPCAVTVVPTPGHKNPRSPSTTSPSPSPTRAPPSSTSRRTTATSTATARS